MTCPTCGDAMYRRDAGYEYYWVCRAGCTEAAEDEARRKRIAEEHHAMIRKGMEMAAGVVLGGSFLTETSLEYQWAKSCAAAIRAAAEKIGKEGGQ